MLQGKFEYHNLAFMLVVIENSRLNYTVRNNLHMSLSATICKSCEVCSLQLSMQRSFPL